MSPPVQSALVVQSCRSPMAHVAAHFDVAAVPRAAAVSQQMPVAQLFVPEHARAPAMQAAVVVHAGRPLPAQQTCVAESHGAAPQAICPAPPSVPRGGVVIPPPPLPPPPMPTLASSPVMPPSSPAGDASSPTPLLPELVPPPELPPAPELLAVPELLPAPELVPPPSSLVSVVEPDPLQPIAITTDAPRNVRKADIEVPPRTFFAVSSGAQWSVGFRRLHKCDARSA
jgi:hypothetical protein